jgi:hypothetical protein
VEVVKLSLQLRSDAVQVDYRLDFLKQQLIILAADRTPEQLRKRLRKRGRTRMARGYRLVYPPRRACL